MDEIAAGIESGDRALLSRGITLVESTRAADRKAAQTLLDRLAPRIGKAARIGITGIPGVGKSTFIEAIGCARVAAGQRIAVVAVDPSSEATGGSILGDKTRMGRLSREPLAYIRPSPSADATGGVAPRTREVIALCEAAGFDWILVETVGTGQSELAVAHMVDTFVLLALAGTGDELQGIKRGVMEMADIIVIHKADGAAHELVQQACADFSAAQRLQQHGRGGWTPPVLPASSATGAGLDRVWEAVQQHRAHLGEAGITEKRRRQALHWFEEIVRQMLEREFLADPAIAAALPAARQSVLDRRAQPEAAAAELLRRRTR